MSRAGKPWVSVSGSPFMPMAIMASRPSRTTPSGVLMVNPSTAVLSSWSLDVPTPARSSTSASRTPSQRAAPM